MDVNSDVKHCGACGTVCADSRSCRGGSCTYDLIAANHRAYGRAPGQIDFLDPPPFRLAARPWIVPADAQVDATAKLLSEALHYVVSSVV